MGTNGSRLLMQMGDEAMNQENGAAQAVDYYQKSLQIQPANTEVIYKLGMAFKSMGDTDTANQYFGDIIMNYPNSDYADDAKDQRGY